MKKIIALALICFLATLSLTGCGNTNEITELRQRVEILESKISEYENSQTAEDQPKGETNETTSTSTETNAVTSYLDVLAKSNNYDNWTKVAESEEANETHLLTIAQKCSAGHYSNLAQKIADNKSTTGIVMEELAKSTAYYILEVVAESDKSNEQALLTIAQKCSAGNYSNLAQKIADNKATTGAVMEELAKSTGYYVLEVVAESDKSSEQALLTILQKCSAGNYPNLKQKIEDNFKRKSNSVSVNP